MTFQLSQAMVNALVLISTDIEVQSLQPQGQMYDLKYGYPRSGAIPIGVNSATIAWPKVLLAGGLTISDVSNPGYPNSLGSYVLIIKPRALIAMVYGIGLSQLAGSIPSLPLNMTMEYAFNPIGGAASFFQQIGCTTNFQPTLSTPVPVFNN